MSKNVNSTPLPGDNPVLSCKDDRLERADYAETFTRQVLALDVSEGAVVAVFGPWGSGKTSFINFTREVFERADVPVLDFNPWLFSGAEQLVKRFFEELSIHMGNKKNLRTIGMALRKYGATLNATASIASKLLAIPLIGHIVFAITEITGKNLLLNSIDDLRGKVEFALRTRNKPIIVVLDDVDRLSGHEIREVFKLVRLTASFPNLMYIVACDRLRVEQALSKQGVSGRDYLEKIVQWPYNLPEVSSHLLTQQLFDAINNSLTDIENPGPIDNSVWCDVHGGMVQPLIRNMRDVRRYAIAIRETVSGINGQVALADVLGLEAIRVFLPDVFLCLPGAINGLTVTSHAISDHPDWVLKRHYSNSGFHMWLKARVDGLITVTETDRDLVASKRAREVVEVMINLLFPRGAWLRRISDGDAGTHENEDAAKQFGERRVAHEHILRLYLERVTSPDLLAFHYAKRALACMTDHDKLNEFIRTLDVSQWQNVVLNICYHGDQFRPEHVEPGIVVLMNLLPDISEQSSGTVCLDDIMATIQKAAYQLLTVFKETDAIEAEIHNILRAVTSLSSKLELVILVGYKKNSGRMLISETAATEFETSLRNEIRATPTDELAGEWNPLRILHFAKSISVQSEQMFDIDDSPELTFSLLQSVRGGAIIGSLGYRTLRRTSTLDLKSLINLYDSEEVLKTRIENLKAQLVDMKPWLTSRGISLDDAKQLLELADIYLSGWQSGAD